MLIRRFKHKRQFKIILLGRGGFFSGVSRVRWGLVPRGRRGENERSLEKRIEGVERWFWRKNEVWLKVKKKGKNCFKR